MYQKLAGAPNLSLWFWCELRWVFEVWSALVFSILFLLSGGRFRSCAAVVSQNLKQIKSIHSAIWVRRSYPLLRAFFANNPMIFMALAGRARHDVLEWVLKQFC